MTMLQNYKIIELIIDEDQEAILESISLVDNPAIERDFMYFSKESKPRYYFEEEDQRIIVGPAMIPEMRIPRKEDGEIYYVYFSKATIAKAAELFLKHNKASKQNTDHKNNFNEGIYLMESWIIEDQYDKAFTKYGFKALPIGTWMTKMRVLDNKVWAEVKEGKYKGFSVQGDFILGQTKYEKAFAGYKRKYAGVRKKWNKLYKNLSAQEKIDLDQILFLVELNEMDYFENPELAIKRSKELGLNGEIHSHFDEELKILIYMPGSSHDDYEKAMAQVEVEMELDVTGLPDYVKEGATGANEYKPISQMGFVEVTPGESKDAYISRCMSSLQGEFPREDQRYAVCISEYEGSAMDFAAYPWDQCISDRLGEGKSQESAENICGWIKANMAKEGFANLNLTEKRIVSNFLREIAQTYGLNFSQNYEFETYRDYPEGATNNARRALDWKEKNGSDCGTPVGWARARQLADRQGISEETIARMASFERHRQNSETPYSEGCGGIMWDAWGGDSGIRWAQTKLREIRGEQMAAVEDLKVGDEVSWKTADKNPRGRIREIIKDGSKRVPGRDFEVSGTPDNPGYIIEIYTENAEGNWEPSGEYVGRKADSILKNVQL